MNIIKDIKPKALAQRTTATIANPGITYNQAGITYNQIGIIYGGASGQQNIFLSHSLAKDIHP